MEPRLARPEDAVELVRLAAMMFGSMGLEVDDPIWRANAEKAARERFAGADDAVAYVVDHPTEAGRLVACGAATIARRLPSPLNRAGLAGYVQWMSTEPEFQRRGLGRALLKAIIAWLEARGVGAVDLHATPAGEPLYRSEGFGDSFTPALRRGPRPPASG